MAMLSAGSLQVSHYNLGFIWGSRLTRDEICARAMMVLAV
jgi:hypothetical protein